MQYKSILFDWDGVLAMTLHLWLASYRNELQKLGHHYSDKTIIEDFFYEHDKTKLKYPLISFDTFGPGVHKHMLSQIASLKTYPGATEMLQTLQKNNIALALVSSSQRTLLKAGLQETGLDQFFSILVSGDDVMKHKPDPEPFLNAVEMGKFDPNSSLIIGDSYTDIIAAQGAGIDSCLYLPKENEIFYDFEKLKATNPTYIIEDLSARKILSLVRRGGW